MISPLRRVSLDGVMQPAPVAEAKRRRQNRGTLKLWGVLQWPEGGSNSQPVKGTSKFGSVDEGGSVRL